jgi:single-strand DNA-binding protein
MQLNHLELAGYVGREPEYRKTQGGEDMVSFSLCYSRKLKDGKSEATWVQVVCFGWAAEASRGIKKGDNVFVSGMLRVSQYQDKDGRDRTSVSLLARAVGVLVKAEKSEAVGAASAPLDDLDAIPF